MLTRKLLAGLALAAACAATLAAPAANAGSSATSAAPAASTTQFQEVSEGACTANVQGAARQAAEIEACRRYEHSY